MAYNCEGVFIFFFHVVAEELGSECKAMASPPAEVTDATSDASSESHWYSDTDNESDNEPSDTDWSKRPTEPPREVQINIACDKLASAATEAVAANGAPPLPHSWSLPTRAHAPC